MVDMTCYFIDILLLRSQLRKITIKITICYDALASHAWFDCLKVVNSA